LKVTTLNEFFTIYPECSHLEIELQQFINTHGIKILSILNGLFFRIKKDTIKKIQINYNNFMVKAPIEPLNLTFYIYYKLYPYEVVNINIKTIN